MRVGTNSSLVIVDAMLGQTFTSVSRVGERLIFRGEKDSFYFWHRQDCCEKVWIEDIVGDLKDLEHSPVIEACECSVWSGDADGSLTWTFYRFSTQKGTVTVRWMGSSNGYYSERVSFGWSAEYK